MLKRNPFKLMYFYIYLSSHFAVGLSLFVSCKKDRKTKRIFGLICDEFYFENVWKTSRSANDLTLIAFASYNYHVMNIEISMQ